MKEKKTMGIAAFVAIMTVISAVAVVGVASYSDVVAADADEKVYDIYIDLGGELSSYILCEDPIVDYGGPEWVEVTASSSKDALVAACDLKFGEGSLELTSSGYIKTINGMGGNGICYFSDQSFTGEANQWGISYYPVQFIKESDGWVYGGSPIASYDGDSTTFAIVCQPSSMDEEAVDFTFEEDAYAMSWDTYDMYFDGLQERFNYFYKVYGWEYGTPNEPFFPIVEYERYSFYIDLGGTVSGALLGTEADYGDASWETVWALNPKDALTAACEQKFGEGGVTYSESSWGISIATIGGMSANGISMKSEQSSSWDDVYYYPVQYVMEDGEWGQASQSIPGYTGGSTTFALVMEPITFDGEEHTFADAADQALYEELKSVYAWPGYGAFPEPFVSTVGMEVPRSVEMNVGEEFAVPIEFIPADCTNKNVTMISEDDSIVTVDENGVMTAVSLGAVNIHIFSVYDPLIEYVCSVAVNGFAVDGVVYTVYDYGDVNVVKATGFEEGATTVVIGNEVQCGDLTFKVESIEFTAFVGSSVESATIMVDVEEYAFAKTPLKVVRLEGEIDVGTGAFSNCKKLANVYVSDSVKSIGDRAFYKCVFTDQNGEQIDPVIENMAGHKFLGKNSNLSMYVPELYSQFKVDGIIYKITSIEAMEVAVKGASDDVEEVDIQENVKYLGFTWKVTKIASKAFYNNDNITWVSVYGADVGTKAFAACDSLEVVILDGVGIVGQYAFANSAIDVLYCDAEVLDVSAFSGCVKLTSVGFTNSLTSVGKNAFYKNLFYVDGVKVDRTAANLAGRVFEGGNGVLNAVLLG